MVYLVCFKLRTQKVKFFTVQKSDREETTWKTQAQMRGKYENEFSRSGRAQTGLIWLRIGAGVRLLWKLLFP